MNSNIIFSYLILTKLTFLKYENICLGKNISHKCSWVSSGYHLGKNEESVFPCVTATLDGTLTFKRRIKSNLPFAGIIRSSPYSPRFQDNG